MEKVTGIGGFFFLAKDPKALGRWYQQHLGISLTPSSYEDSVWQQEAGPTVFDPQPETSDVFKGTDKVWMLNFRLRDLDKMAAQLRAAGIAVEIDPQSYPNGRFASLHDLREIRSNCGNLQSQPPRGSLLNSSAPFLDFSWVTGVL
jgi:glyoxylase I family protein